jgi:hypothetical protein
MEFFLHNKISEEQALWWNIYSVTHDISMDVVLFMQIVLFYKNVSCHWNFTIEQRKNTSKEIFELD